MTISLNYLCLPFFHKNLTQPDLRTAKVELEVSLSVITAWFKASGLKFNESKTEICLFSRGDLVPIDIALNGEILTTKSTINVLGIIFDAKLQWGPQVSMAITKASRALNAICLIRNYFNTEELLQLIRSNFYSILLYNSEVWHLQTLNQSLKNA